MNGVKKSDQTGNSPQWCEKDINSEKVKHSEKKKEYNKRVEFCPTEKNIVLSFNNEEKLIKVQGEDVSSKSKSKPKKSILRKRQVEEEKTDQKNAFCEIF